MPVSPRKRAANRRNALKSKGPTTEAGRRTSARNASRHGLSVPLAPAINDPLQQELAQLIELDGIAADVASDLAQKIIDYERNLSFLRQVFIHEMVVELGVGEKKNIDARSWQEHLESELAVLQASVLKGMPSKVKKMSRVITKLSKVATQIARLKAKKQKREAVKALNSQRYFKRASNQLIKALRRL